MRRATLVLAVMAGFALAAGTAAAEHPNDLGTVQLVAHGHGGHHSHHGHHGGYSHRSHHSYHGGPGHHRHGYYGPPVVIYRAPVYPLGYSYPGSMHYHSHSYPGSGFYYSGRNFGFSIGF